MPCFYDTNVLLERGETIFKQHSNEDKFYISSKTLEELEDIKASRTKAEEIRYRARLVERLFKEHEDVYNVALVTKRTYDMLSVVYLPETPDNLIICTMLETTTDIGQPMKFITYDLSCAFICKSVCEALDGVLSNINVEVVSLVEHKDKDTYKGYKLIHPTDEQLAITYNKDISDNVFDCEVNEYAIIKDGEDRFCDVVKWNGTNYSCVVGKHFKSRAFGNIKALDEIQLCAVDSILTNDITVLYGRSGCGKTTLPLAYIMGCIENQKYKKCYIIHDFETLKSAKTLGYVKGELLQKELQTGSIGNILSSKLGDISEVERLIGGGMLEIIPTANIRGMEIPSDCICYVTEAQNLDSYTLKTIIQRCKQGCKLLIEGDIIEQHDTNREVGLYKMIEVFKGHKGFGVVKLKNNYRSEYAELADKL